MAKRRLIISLLAIFPLLLGFWGFGYIRRVDGRNAAAWLSFAAQASRSMSYHAVGSTRSGGRQAQFTLDQANDGRYTIQTVGADGKASTLGFDGKRLWCRTCDGQSSIATSDPQQLPAGARGRIIGTGEVAGRPVVRLMVNSGAAQKEIAIDRQTGVTLAMDTRFHRQSVSTMRVVSIAYQPVMVEGCAFKSTSSAQPATDPMIVKALGLLLRPQWLPRGMAATGAYLGPCSCCGKPMASLHYSDGVTSLTLFEMSAKMTCMAGGGCQVTPTGNMLMDSRITRDIAVTAVGNVDVRTLKRVLESLQ